MIECHCRAYLYTDRIMISMYVINVHVSKNKAHPHKLAMKKCPRLLHDGKSAVNYKYGVGLLAKLDIFVSSYQCSMDFFPHLQLHRFII